MVERRLQSFLDRGLAVQREDGRLGKEKIGFFVGKLLDFRTGVGGRERRPERALFDQEVVADAFVDGRHFACWLAGVLGLDGCVVQGQHTLDRGGVRLLTEEVTERDQISGTRLTASMTARTWKDPWYKSRWGRDI